MVENLDGKVRNFLRTMKDKSTNVKFEWEKFNEVVTKAAEESIRVINTGGTIKGTPMMVLW